jgi:predicted RNA-binding protein with PUA-like domain
MNRWLVKSDPDDYSAADLERDGSTCWDGVKNNTALIHIRNMRPGNEVLIYHSGKDKSVVAVAKVTSEPYPDPAGDDERFAVVDLSFTGWLSEPVPLKAIKTDDVFAEFDLVRISRLSVMPVPAPLFKKLVKMGGSVR